MLHVHKSNDAKILYNMCTDVLASAPASPFDFDMVCAPDGVHESLKKAICDAVGIFVGKIETPRHGAERLIEMITGANPTATAYTTDALTMAICNAVYTQLDTVAFSELKRYFGEPLSAVKVVSFATTVAGVWNEYMMYRAPMLKGWSREPRGWQPHLFAEVSTRLGEQHLGDLALNALALLARQTKPQSPFPRRVLVFGVSTLPPLLLQLYAAVSTTIDVHLFVNAPSQDYFSYIADDEKDEYANPLLRLLGRQAACFQSALIDTAQQVQTVESERFYLDERATVLTTVQRSIVTNRAAEQLAIGAYDGSVQFHQCGSSAREVDVAKNLILDAIDTGKAAPHEIVVMAPDINDYAALIEAAFTDVQLPHSIADRQVAGGTSLAEGVAALMTLLDSRLGLKDVFSVMHHGAVKSRFALRDDDIQNAYHWCKAAGIRLCMNAAHRQQHGLVAFKQNTWQFGIERLFLGLALDEGELFHDISPAGGLLGHEAFVLGALSAFLEKLFALSNQVTGVKLVSAWARLLTENLTQIFDIDAYREEWLTVLSVLLKFSDAAAQVGFEAPIDFAAFRLLLSGKLPLMSRRTGVSGGIRCSSFRFLRGERPKVLVLLGMKEGRFPQESQSPGFDVIAANPKPLDRDAKHDGYHMLLDALLAPSERLLILYSPSEKKGLTAPELCLPARELMAQIEQCVHKQMPRTEEYQIHTIHPANSYDLSYFDQRVPHLFSYIEDDFAAANISVSHVQAIENQKASTGIGNDGYSATDNSGITVMSLSEFLLFWKNPVNFYFTRQLGLMFPSVEELPEDEEPLTLGHLEEWKIGKQLIDGMLQQMPQEQLEALIRSGGMVPVGGIGSHFTYKVTQRARKIVDVITPIVSDSAPVRVPVDVQVGKGASPLRIVGAVDVHNNAVVDYSYSALKDRDLLNTWLKHLLFHQESSEKKIDKSVLVRRSGNYAEVIRFTGNIEDSSETLDNIARYTVEGMWTPLPFTPELAAEYVRKSQKLQNDEYQIAQLRQVYLRSVVEQLKETAAAEKRGLLPLLVHPEQSERFHQLSYELFGSLFTKMEREVVK